MENHVINSLNNMLVTASKVKSESTKVELDSIQLELSYIKTSLKFFIDLSFNSNLIHFKVHKQTTRFKSLGSIYLFESHSSKSNIFQSLQFYFS